MNKTIPVVRGDPVGEGVVGTTGSVEVRVCSDRIELRRAASAPEVVAIATGIRDVGGGSARPELLALGMEAPTVPVVLACSLSPWEASEAVKLASAGFRARWVITPREDVRDAVDQLLLEEEQSRRREEGPELAMVRAWCGAVRVSAHPFMLYATMGSARPVSVRSAAEVLDVSPRALESRLHHDGLPPPKQVLDWCRALRVAWHVDVLGRTGVQATYALGFSSQSAMGSLVRRMTGQTPMGLNGQQGFASQLERFVQSLSAS